MAALLKCLHCCENSFCDNVAGADVALKQCQRERDAKISIIPVRAPARKQDHESEHEITKHFFHSVVYPILHISFSAVFGSFSAVFQTFCGRFSIVFGPFCIVCKPFFMVLTPLFSFFRRRRRREVVFVDHRCRRRRRRRPRPFSLGYV